MLYTTTIVQPFYFPEQIYFKGFDILFVGKLRKENLNKTGFIIDINILYFSRFNAIEK
jgi:hypothetical protein